VAYLTPNESEAAQLTGVAVTDEASARDAARRLLAAGARRALVTLGAKGTLLAETERSVLVSSVPVAAVDTTAAGDAFNGALACAIGCGMPLEEAVRYACFAGALSATRLGAQPSLPTADELQQFIKSTAVP
jgi:ribokinase